MSNPWWLDAATLQWAADYCELMAIRLGDEPRMPAAVGADVCARGLRDAQASAEARPCPPATPPLLSMIEGAGDG
jgi:hypothetical protein